MLENEAKRKYLKYKEKYLQLKKLIGGVNTNADKELKTLVTSLIKNFIIPFLVEVNCCKKNLNVVYSKSKNQNNYLTFLKDTYNEFSEKIRSIIIKVAKDGNLNNITELLNNEIKNLSVNNIGEELSDNEVRKRYIIPICLEFANQYIKLIKKIYDYIQDKKLPVYKIKNTDELKKVNLKQRNDKENCIKNYDSQTCCGETENASNCILMLGTKTLPNLNEDLKKIKKILMDNKTNKDLNDYNYTKSYILISTTTDSIMSLINIFTKKKKEIDDYNKNLKRSFINKIQYGSEEIPISIKL
ncbi:hypothetical protein Catovirus_2_8 [Catovirus CTV1]|uniref:Uncharacterized protein n=1 Tax=Catovirus CTV1 TaxID=1977631 RepID=A0A1V0SBI0_9VIRU|nr:hypothetical protein Catovirus_2_8 [Catovirus CTV1]